MAWFGIAWNIVVWTLLALDPHPKLDLKHCTYDPATHTKYCLPKDGCWISDTNGAVTCYRVAKLVGR